MIPSIYFKEELEKSQIIDEFTCKSWKEDYSKDEFREVIREIETKGPEAFDPGDIRKRMRAGRGAGKFKFRGVVVSYDL